LHDGALIITENQIAAAGCFLPLTENPYISKELGTRHRAAIGISEQTDAIAIIVSEETGVISLANGGKITRFLDEKTLRQLLVSLCAPKPEGLHAWARRFGNK
ncbi:MAG: TIGR00159 family protein, partial [Firmicutes bacterium]|nr:TIGR00159 family protein [Bacillota bacterium]